MLSNILSDTVDLLLYDFDYGRCLHIAMIADTIKFDVDIKERFFMQHTVRNDQTSELLDRLSDTLKPCNAVHSAWLLKRGIGLSGVYSIDYQALSEQDKLNLFLYPCDHILDNFGYKVVDHQVKNTRIRLER